MTAMAGPATRRLAVLLGLLVGIASPGEAPAGPCDGVPLCERQTMAAVGYSAWQTRGWAYYCTGDHPYYWNNDSVLGFGNNFSFDNTCFTVTENPFAEGEPSKMDATITNWCLKHEEITVTLGCSAQPQVVSCPANSTSRVITDPGCPMQAGTYKNYCSGGPVPVCFQTWTEQCQDGPVYCTDEFTGVWCITCGP